MLKSSTAIVLSLALLAATPAWAAVLVNETFSYTNGALVGKTPEVGTAWAAHSGAGAKPVQVTDGQAVIQQSSGSGEDINVGTGTALGAGGKWYSAFDLTIPAGSSTSDVCFAHFLQGTGNFTSRVWLTAPAGGSGYRLALSNGSSITGTGVAKTDDLTFGTTYRVITSYDFDAKAGSIWIDPVSETSPSFAATDAGYGTAVTAYAFRQASPSSGSSTQVVDNLMVGTTFGEVVPEPATLTLLAAAGALVWRRRR